MMIVGKTRLCCLAAGVLKYTALLAVDAAHMGLTAFVDLEPAHAATTSQISLNRMDTNGDMLGFMHATEFSLGQLYTSAVPLVSDIRVGGISMPQWAHLQPTDFEIDHTSSRQNTDSWQFHDTDVYQGMGLSLTNLLTWKSESGIPSQGQGQLLLNR